MGGSQIGGIGFGPPAGLRDVGEDGDPAGAPPHKILGWSTSVPKERQEATRALLMRLAPGVTIPSANQATPLQEKSWVEIEPKTLDWARQYAEAARRFAPAPQARHPFLELVREQSQAIRKLDLLPFIARLGHPGLAVSDPTKPGQLYPVADEACKVDLDAFYKYRGADTNPYHLGFHTEGDVLISLVVGSQILHTAVWGQHEASALQPAVKLSVLRAMVEQRLLLTACSCLQMDTSRVPTTQPVGDEAKFQAFHENLAWFEQRLVSSAVKEWRARRWTAEVRHLLLYAEKQHRVLEETCGHPDIEGANMGDTPLKRAFRFYREDFSTFDGALRRAGP